METIHVPISELGVGKVISEDIFANTQYPIIFKDTMISYVHLQVFHAFNIFNVPVYKSENDTRLEKNEIDVEVTIEEIPTFRKVYNHSVEQFKRNLKLGSGSKGRYCKSKDNYFTFSRDGARRSYYYF